MEQNKVNIEVVSIDDLIQDDHNFNKGNEQGAQLLERSFRECGAGRSVLIDKDNRLVGGNKAQKGFKAAGKKKVIIVDSDADTLVAVRRKDVSLDSAEGRKMAYLDNLTTQVNLTWDETELEAVQADVEGFDVADFGFDIEDLPQVTFPTGDETEEQAIERKRKEFEEKMAAGELDENDPEYQEFVKKFEAKRTTDDCYTPDIIYDAIADWVASEYNLSRANFVRPFYPGGDYQKERYKPTDIVVDNPPFSILANIIDWYNERGIRYFLFGPQLTLLGTCAKRCTTIAIGAELFYENGAQVATSFATNLEPSDIVAKVDSRLFSMIDVARRAYMKTVRQSFPKYIYPKNLIMTHTLKTWAQYGIDFVLKKDECVQVEQLDAQKESGKAIYGKGLLMSDRKTEERIKNDALKLERQVEKDKEKEIADREESTVWPLSDREREIIKGLK